MTPKGYNVLNNIRIDGVLMDLSETVTDELRLPENSKIYFEGDVADQQPGISDPKLSFHTGYQHNAPPSMHCNFAGDECWTIKSHPKIEKIDYNSGLKSGGQLLTIEGFGLDGSSV